MNPWARGRGKGDYAEWFPELDLHIASRWEGAAGKTHPEHVQVITRVEFVAELDELGETA